MDGRQVDVGLGRQCPLGRVLGPSHYGNETVYCVFDVPPGFGSSRLQLETPSDGRRNQKSVIGYIPSTV
jgi:hypothetical protein